MKKIFSTGFFLLALCGLLAFKAPKHWYMAGDKPGSYAVEVQKTAGPGTKNSVIMKSIDKKIDGFGTLMQTCLAEKFHGKRVRISAMIKTTNVEEWAGLWFRVDQAGSNRALAFDNMEDRPIKGTTDWKRYETILDVSPDAFKIAYGFLLSGTGELSFSDFKIETVDDLVPTTGLSVPGPLKEPSNLDFTE